MLEVVGPPAVDRLCFWALQVSFLEGREDRGAAHVGLQWNRNHPGGRAVNWGGYAAGGGLLAGSPSSLPSTPGDPNTRDYPWDAGRPYRLRVCSAAGPPGRWRGEVTDLRSGRATVIRDLDVAADRLAAPVVWSEVFARCEEPAGTVRWTGFEAVTSRGERVEPTGLSVNYQDHASGGCDNTTVATDGRGVLQITDAPRAVPQGTVIDLPGGAAGGGAPT